MFSLALYGGLITTPKYLSNVWRMKASNQMVISIFYTVSYMRHTSNLELAIEFAADHLSPPLSIDLKKVLWDVETEKFSSIKESYCSTGFSSPLEVINDSPTNPNFPLGGFKHKKLVGLSI